METTTLILIIAMLFVMSTGLFFIFKADAERERNKVFDRFFLEEIIKRLHNGDMDYVETLLFDWMHEKTREYPLTEEERENVLREVIGNDANFLKEAYFGSEKELMEHIT